MEQYLTNYLWTIVTGMEIELTDTRVKAKYQRLEKSACTRIALHVHYLS
jgi:hypothetical protein